MCDKKIEVYEAYAEDIWKILNNATEIRDEVHIICHINEAQRKLEQCFNLCNVCGEKDCFSDHK